MRPREPRLPLPDQGFAARVVVLSAAAALSSTTRRVPSGRRGLTPAVATIASAPLCAQWMKSPALPCEVQGEYLREGGLPWISFTPSLPQSCLLSSSSLHSLYRVPAKPSSTIVSATGISSDTTRWAASSSRFRARSMPSSLASSPSRHGSACRRRGSSPRWNRMPISMPGTRPSGYPPIYASTYAPICSTMRR